LAAFIRGLVPGYDRCGNHRGGGYCNLEATADYKDIPPEPPPWTYGTEIEAIEELEVNLPSSFSLQLYYIEMPYEGGVLFAL
jgi:hypothetical protein